MTPSFDTDADSSTTTIERRKFISTIRRVSKSCAVAPGSYPATEGVAIFRDAIVATDGRRMSIDRSIRLIGIPDDGLVLSGSAVRTIAKWPLVGADIQVDIATDGGLTIAGFHPDLLPSDQFPPSWQAFDVPLTGRCAVPLPKSVIGYVRWIASMTSDKVPVDISWRRESKEFTVSAHASRDTPHEWLRGPGGLNYVPVRFPGTNVAPDFDLAFNPKHLLQSHTFTMHLALNAERTKVEIGAWGMNCIPFAADEHDRRRYLLAPCDPLR